MMGSGEEFQVNGRQGRSPVDEVVALRAQQSITPLLPEGREDQLHHLC